MVLPIETKKRTKNIQPKSLSKVTKKTKFPSIEILEELALIIELAPDVKVFALKNKASPNALA